TLYFNSKHVTWSLEKKDSSKHQTKILSKKDQTITAHTASDFTCCMMHSFPCPVILYFNLYVEGGFSLYIAFTISVHNLCHVPEDVAVGDRWPPVKMGLAGEKEDVIIKIDGNHNLLAKIHLHLKTKIINWNKWWFSMAIDFPLLSFDMIYLQHKLVCLVFNVVEEERNIENDGGTCCVVVNMDVLHQPEMMDGVTQPVENLKKEWGQASGQATLKSWDEQYKNGTCF
ncbi:hypothetical protein ACJX0J_029549, partial [Zea mays]